MSKDHGVDNPKRSLVNFFNVLATPTDVFNELKENPRWLVAFLITSIISMTATWSYGPIANHLSPIDGSEGLTEQQIEQILSRAQTVKKMSIAVTSLRLLIKITLLACSLFFLFVLLEAKDISFNLVFTVVVYSEAVLMLMEICNVLLLYAKGTESIGHVTDLRPILGLHYLMSNKASNFPLFKFLSSINVFSVWYIATLATGVSVITNFSKLKSAFIVTAVWLLGVGFQVALAAISSRASVGIG